MSINDNITIVIVIYNSSNVIFDCLKSLENFKIIIVDNGKNSKILSQLQSKKNITIIPSRKNLGMGRGANLAFQSIKTDFFLLLSPDTKMDENSIQKLANTASTYDNCAISAPLNYLDINSYGILPEKRDLYEKNKDRIHLHKDKLDIKPEGEICVDITKGCALLIKSKYFAEVGGFSEKYFLFWEEIDLCKKFLKKNLTIIVNPSSVVHHSDGKSTKVDLENLFIRSYHHELSPLYYFGVKKNSPRLYKNILKYLFRTISYLFILNFKNSIKNFSKLSANITFIFR